MRENYKNQIHSVFSDIRGAQYVQAFSKLDNIHPETRNEKRIQSHAYGILYMRNGEFFKAAKKMQEGIELHGSHISLLTDLAASQFLAGQIYNWQNSIHIIERTLSEIEGHLSVERRVAAYTSLAKFKEELGEVHSAIKLYKIISQLCESKLVNNRTSYEYIRALSNIMRLKSQHNIKDDFHTLYKRLVLHSEADSDLDVDFETQHALVLSELLFLDPGYALSRTQNLMKSPYMQTEEKNLLYIDISYYCCLNDQEIPNWLKSEIPFLKNLTISEKILVDIMYEKKKFTLDQINSWAQLLAPAPYLRALLLLVKMKKSDDAIRKKLFFAVSSLAPQSQKIWKDYIDGLLPAEISKKNLHYCHKTQTLTFGDQVLSFARKQGSRELLELLMREKSISLAKAIFSLWGGDSQDYEISRLKMRIIRLDKDIFTLGYCNDLIVIKGDQIMINTVISSTY